MAKYKNNHENTMLSDAIALAVMAHRGQIRKDPEEMPYIVHPLHVMQILIDCGVDNKYVLAAAVLHDVVEDTHVGIKLLRRQFSELTCDIVEALSKSPSNKGTMHEKSAAGHAQTMELVKGFKHTIRIFGVNLIQAVNPAILIKQADRASNLMGAFPTNWDLKTHEQYYMQSEEIHALDVNTKVAGVLAKQILNYRTFIDKLRALDE